MSMVRSISRVVIPIVGSVVIVGCEKSTESVSQEPQDSRSSERWDRAFVYMTDNATMHDLSLCDAHFVPHTNELNSLGTARLERFAALLHGYGGVIHYQPGAESESDIESRLSHIREYLGTTGFDVHYIEFAVGLPQGRDLRAHEALTARTKADAVTYQNNTTLSGGSSSGSGS